MEMESLWFGFILIMFLSSKSANACSKGQFLCKNGECLDIKYKCNRVIDCEGGSDEADCYYSCSANLSPCQDGHCVAKDFFCNKENDCGDWSDELNCNEMESSVASSLIDCPPNSFECDSQTCIPENWVCDGKQDCPDAKDELNCVKKECSDFQCKGKCISRQWLCDGFEDCTDGSDENECSNRSTLSSAFSCPVGFQLDGNICVDIDECLINPPMCSQKCTNTHGGFECSCMPGYSQNQQICIADREPTLLVTTDKDIRYISLRSKEYALIKSNISGSHGISSYNDEDRFDFVYWNEKNKQDKSVIYKSMLDGSAHQSVVSFGIEMVEDLAIDSVARHVYFTDSGRKHIVVCDLEGIICTVLIEQLDKPRAVAVYPEVGLLFWTDWGSHQPYIGSAGMDGSEQKKLITTEVVWPNGIAVDETIQRIFWTDAKLDRIESSRTDGFDRRVLPVKVTHPYAIDVFENMVYWCDPIEHQVLSANKFTGKNHQVLIKTASSIPTGIHVHHPLKQSSISNPCRSVVCSHLCLLAPSSEGFRCACPVGMTLNKNNNRTCNFGLTSQPSAIIIATFTEIYRLTYLQIGRDSIIRLPTRNLGNIGALAFNPMANSIVYSDIKHKTIYSMSLEAYHQTVLFENVATVEGLDVDPYTENIYWTEASRGTIAIGYRNQKGVYERLVLARQLYNPKGITLAPEFGLMFVVEGRNSHLNVWYMDGSLRQKLVRVYGTISAMASDGKHVYFSDSLRGTIERIDLDGKNRTLLLSNLYGTLMDMDTSSDSVFWLAQFSSQINWMSKKEPKSIRSFVIDSSTFHQYRLVAVLHNFAPSRNHACLRQDSMCSDICVPGPKKVKCLCPVGKTLSDDEEVCLPTDCKSDDKNWFKSHAGCCIPVEFQCDNVNDCALGEDEENCNNLTNKRVSACSKTKSSDQFQCNNGDCISSHFYCDGDADCEDGSDEPNTCPPHECLSDIDYPCPNQHICIPRSAVCDGYADCADKSDEANCIDIPSICSSNEFDCTLSKVCIPEDCVCDGVTDCEHGEDEEESYCANVSRKNSCPTNSIRCPPDPDCIPRMALCNNAVECEHLTDEDLCEEHNDVKTFEECTRQSFNCFMGSDGCIPISSRCDCQFDCSFGEDEDDCEILPIFCTRNLFRCPNEMRYINISWICDDVADCLNSADEETSLCNKTGAFSLSGNISQNIRSLYTCTEDEFECANGQCIPSNLVCDETSHCLDGTDEGDNCTTSCEQNGCCPQTCIPGPEGPTCVCEPGYISHDNGRKCEDVDECTVTGENLCSQYCDNVEGSYRCSCAPGYSLEQDHQTCKTINGRPLLIAASGHRVAAFLLDNDVVSNTEFEIESSGVIKGIAYQNKLSTLYWITAEGHLSRSNSDGQQALIYKLDNLLIPSGLALDTTTGNIYISAVIKNGKIEEDKSVVKVISHLLDADTNIVTTETKINDIVIDGFQGMLFWSEQSTGPHTGRIIRSTMDGKLTRWLHPIENIMFPVALALDPIKLRIYWADMILQSISSSDYDGKQQKLVTKTTNGQPISLTFFENRISWGLLQENNVIYSQLLKDNSKSTISVEQQQFAGGSGTIATTAAIKRLLTIHSVMEPEFPNPCAASPCSNGLCLLKNSSSFVCLCPTGVNVFTFTPFRCVDICPRHFFRCPPDLDCLPRSLVCNIDPECENLSEQDLCMSMNNIAASGTVPGTTASTDINTRTIIDSLLRSTSVIPNVSERFFEDRTFNDTYGLPSFDMSFVPRINVKTLGKSGRKVIFSRRIEIRDEVAVQDGQDMTFPIELTLQAILDGPAHVLSRVFTKKGHYIDHVAMFNEENTPVPINAVWEVTNQTRFVEDVKVPKGNRLILWKIFRPQAYTDYGNLRSVHLMELRTLKKMGFQLIAVNLKKWNELEEPGKINYLKEEIVMSLSRLIDH